MNEDERRFREKTSGLFQKYHLDSLYKAYSKDQDEEIMDQINEASEEMQAEIDEYEKAFIEENPAAFYSAILAKQMSFGLSAEQIEGIIEMLDPALQETDLIQGVAEEMEMLRQTDVSVGSFTNNVPDIGYQVDNEYPGKDHTNIKYLATFPNDDICSLRNDGTLSIIDSKGNLVRDFKTDLTSKPTSIAIDPASGHIYIMGTMTETKEAKFRGKVYKQEVQIGVECLVYDANGKRIRNLNLEDVKTSTGSKIVNGKLFIADYRSRKVAIFNVESGEYESSINDARACCGILDFGVNDKNEILLANLGAFRVQSFDMAGNIQYSFGKRGRGLNDFHGCCNPVNVSYLPNGAIITVEKDPTRIKVYTKSGAHKVEGVQELVKGCSYIPMTTDSKNNLYLASVMSGIVKCSPIETIP